MIGILDSGFGGLSIYQSITALLPHESTVYIGDHAYLPYNAKTQAVIRSRIRKLIRFLIAKRCSLIVIACNTATVAGIAVYRRRFPDIPIVGVVPVVKTASEISKTKKIAVLSTTFTAKSPYQKKLIRQFASDCRVYNLGCPSLISFVEDAMLHGIGIEKELRAILAPLAGQVDVVALGCTHYPFLKDQIRAIVGKDVAILDSGEAVARQVSRIVAHNHIETNSQHGTHSFFSTRQWPGSSSIASALLQRKVQVQYAAV